VLPDRSAAATARWFGQHPEVEIVSRDRCGLYRAVDSRSQTIDFPLPAKRDAEAATRFFRKASAHLPTVNPRTITVDKNAAYPKGIAEMKKDGELWRRSRPQQVKYLNNIVKRDHRNVRRREPRWPRLRWLLHSPENTGKLRGDGDDEEGASSEHRRQRHPDPGNVHCRTISSCGLSGE
jgi:hypothetical protein